MPRPGEYPNIQNIIGTEDLTVSMVDDPGLKVVNARNLVRFLDVVSPPTAVPGVGVPPGEGVWAAPWITSEDAASGLQDIARGGLRLVTPTGAGQASWATQEISSINVALRASVLLPTLGHFFSSVYFRASTDFASKLQFKHVVSATGAHSVILSEWVDNVETTLAVSAVNYGVDGIEYKLSVVGDKFQAKLWPTGTAEPLEWIMDVVVPVRQTKWLALVAKGGDAGAAREIVYRDLSVLPITVTQPPDDPVPQTQTFTTGATADDVGFTMTRGVFAPTTGVLRATATSDAIGFYTYNTGSNDHYAQADLVTGSNITGIYSGLTVRHSADDETFYLMETVNGGSAVRLMRSVAGQYTQIGGTGGQGAADIFTDDMEGRSQGVTNGTLLTSTNSYARINQAIPVAGYIQQGNPNTYYSGGTGPNSNGQPRFSTTAKNGTLSARFGLVTAGSGVFGGSFYHYSAASSSQQIYFEWWYRFDSTFATAAQAGAFPGLWLAREDWSNFDLQTPRLGLNSSLGLTHGSAVGSYAMSANTWYKMASHINCANGTITTTIRDESLVLRDTIVSTANGVPRVGFIEFGALWCNMQSFATTGYCYWDDVQMSTQPIGSTGSGNVATSLTTNSTYKLRLEAQGSSIRGYIDDVAVISAEDTGITTGVHGGVKLYPGASLLSSVSVDNFTVGALTSTPTVSRTTLVTQPLPAGTPVSSLGFTPTTSAAATPARFFYGGTGVFQTPIAQSEVTAHPRSAAIVSTLANGSNDRGLTLEAYAMSVVDVDPDGDTYQVIIRNDSIYGGAWGGSGSWGFNNITYLYPTIKIQPGAQIPSGTDRSLIIRDWVNGRALSFWVTTIDETNKRILADWGGAFPANSDGNSIAPNYSPGPYGVDFGSINRTTGAGAVYGHTAVGLSGYQGNVTFADMERGYIDHALVFATKMIAGPPQSPGTAFYFPATTNDGNELGNDRIEAGARIQLMSSDATINAISNPGQRMIARALKEYGAFVCDYAGAMATFVAQRPRQGVSSELSLFSQHGFNVSGDGWNPLTQINWNDVRVLITTKGSQVGLVGSTGVSLNNTDMGTSDHWVEADLVVGSTVANQTVGVVARASSNNSYYVFETSGSTNSMRLRAVVAGSTATSWTGPFTPSPNSTYKLRLDVVGSNINCYVDGVLLISVSDTTLQTQTRVGIVSARTGNQLETVTLSSFKAGNFLTGGSNGGGEPPTGGLAFIQGFSTGSTGADANFTMLRGALTIASGQLRASALSTEIDGYHTTDLGSEHHYVQSDCVIGASDTGTYWAINARMATSGLTYYSAEVQPGRGVTLLRVVGGTYTSLGYWASGWSLNSTHTLKLECNGSTITVSADGTPVITVTDGGITTGTKVGVHIYTSGAVTNLAFDNFGGKAVAWNGTTPPVVTPPPTGGGGGTTPPPTSTSETASVGNQGGGYYYNNFDNATNAASAGLDETPGGGLHGFNIPITFSGGVGRPQSFGAGYGDCIAFPAQNDISADQFARAKIRIGAAGSTGGNTGTGTFTGVMVRVVPTSGSGYPDHTDPNSPYSWYKMETDGFNANTVRWVKLVRGDVVGGGSFYWQLNPNTTYDFYLEIKGNTLTGYIDGVFVFSTVDYDLTTGKPGISLYNDVYDQSTVLDFEAGGFPAGGGTTTNLFVGSLSGGPGWVPAPQESGTNNIVGTGSFLAF